ncbi:GNAT family N-acetyltransferase [Qipengyuania sphaerica]|uniref:GNAT family N-acetyltransferase n=1 Tax=Qipengyuania sphaerica TaxID=2867243 RepID=UPI001C8A08BB|nr:GNAT family N-acetyltransferase [Qipengyuania sphaerica]MBX7541944.1 GNAT family N-acetyltransferase [Qipengyuania sphaerica]
MEVQISLDPPAEHAARLSRGIMEFNAASIPDLERVEDEIRFHVLATDDAGELAGGLRGTCYWNTLHIELLWLSEDARALRLGSRIVEEAERFARSEGCEKAFVETTSWQARPFYEKAGYVLMATLEGRPKGHSTHYLMKELSAV